MSFLNPLSWKKVPTQVEVICKHLAIPEYGSKSTVFNIPKNHPLNQYNLLPPPPESDLWRLQAYKKLMENFFEMWKDKNGWFSICAVDRYIEFYEGDTHCARSSEEYKKLQTIHCVHWNAMHPEIAQAVPGLFNIVLVKAGLAELVVAQTPEEQLIQDHS